jgi:hypothetical protein
MKDWDTIIAEHYCAAEEHWDDSTYADGQPNWEFWLFLNEWVASLGSASPELRQTLMPT